MCVRNRVGDLQAVGENSLTASPPTGVMRSSGRPSTTSMAMKAWPSASPTS
jgi:hypothetical protein